MFQGDVEALLIMNYKDNKNITNRKYKVLTNLHTLKRNVKERERVEKASMLQLVDADCFENKMFF